MERSTSTGLWQDAWRRLKRNRMAMVGVVITIVMSISALFAPWISPFDPELQQRWLGALPPGSETLDLRNEMRFEVGVVPGELDVPERCHDVLGDGAPHVLEFDVRKAVIAEVRVVVDDDLVEKIEVSGLGATLDRPDRLDLVGDQFLRVKGSMVALDGRSLVLGEPVPPDLEEGGGRRVLQLERVEWPQEGRANVRVDFGPEGRVRSVKRNDEQPREAFFKVYPQDVVEVTLDGVPLRHRHPLGTDQKGRDTLSRLIYGGRISLLVGITATLVSLLIGVVYGAFSGYAGGKTDAVLMRIVDILFGVPYLFLVILMLVAFGRSVINLFIALGAVQWLVMARIVRGQVLSLREKEFVDAAITVGTRPAQILFRHLIPNTLGVVVVYTTLTVPAVILEESFLAFLGLTVEWQGRPLESWGALVNQGREALGAQGEYWWLLLWPSIAMSLTLFSLNFLGDGLRDALDPQQRGKK